MAKAERTSSVGRPGSPSPVPAARCACQAVELCPIQHLTERPQHMCHTWPLAEQQWCCC